MNAQNNRWHILLLLFIIWKAAIAQTQSACEAALLEAEQKYQAGKLDSALVLINGCLVKKDATRQDKASAYEFLGKVYIALDEIEQAKNAFGEMLKVNSKITLDPTMETPEVMAIFNEVKQKQRQAGKSKKWLWFRAGGLVAAGITAAIIFQNAPQGSSSESFVLPLGRPPR